eukprot:CAMPEP_0173470748 /NCGR_PEP_ID=MMETSP1357-20121228/78042_1 /TAXON_ID=77926 /ORGANISM="Hemiselmis rufescens, Strain PCC563" /LENGTH=313 /DNA_ID=CAMNT_0014439037 /DNA_START=17 /DNA_END=954 /DNA_ORIENTATION=+
MILTIDLKRKDESAIQVVAVSHSRDASGLTTSPTGKNYFLTTSSDCTLKRWQISPPMLLQSAHLGIKSICVCLSPDENLAAVGHVRGRFTVWDLGHPDAFTRGREGPMPRCLLKNTYRSEDIADIKFSPNGRFLAVASREQTIDVYDVPYDFNRLGVCRGHSAAVLHVDFTVDSKFLRSSCAASEVLYWDIPGCSQRSRGRDLKDAEWATHSVNFGWSLRGMWHAGMLGTSIGSVDVSNSLQQCVCGEDSGSLRLFRYPAMPGCKWKEFGGAASHVAHTRFTLDDKYLISSVMDGTVMVWNHVPPKGASQSVP